MQSRATTVEEYLAQLPEDRREAIRAVRAVILRNLPEGVVEGVSYGMIGYFVPHSIYPKGYHCDPKAPLPFANLASQKNHMAVYLMNLSVSEDEAWFRERWARSGKKLDMGKSCVRFKKLDDVALDALSEAIARVSVAEHIARYEAALTAPRAGRPTKNAAKKAPARKKTAAGSTTGNKKKSSSAGASKATRRSRSR